MRDYTRLMRADFLVALAAAILFTLGCGASPKSVPANTYVYVSQFYQNPPLTGPIRGAFAQLQVANDGILTKIAPSSLDVSSIPLNLAVDPVGKFLLATNSTNSWGTISEFIIGNDGTLTANSAATVTTNGSPVPLAFTPDGRFVVAADNWLNMVSSYSFSATGTLTLINTVTTGNFPEFVAIDPSGKFLYVASGSGNDNLISEYTISPDGMLASVGSISTGGSTALAVSPKGFVYSVTTVPPTVTEFSINPSSGTLTQVDAFTTGLPRDITFHPSGAYAYVAHYDLSVSQFAVDANTGALTTNGPDLAGIGGVVVDPSGKTAFAFSDADTVSSFTIGGNGQLSPAGKIDLGNPSLAQRIVVARD